MCKINYWTTAEETQLQDLINQNSKNLSSCFETFSKTSGRSKAAIAYHYYSKRKAETDSDSPQKSSNKHPWTKPEDDRLLRQIKAFPGNISWCCLMVSQEIGRTKEACLSRWYQYLSKRPDVLVNYNITETTVMRNRKNGKGMPSNSRVWKKILYVLRKFI